MSKKILIVEDDGNIRELLRLYLEREGYEITEAENGEEGVAQWRKVNPDMILLDVMMPVMDGWEVCKIIRAESKVPIIILTAKGETFDKVNGLEMGADDYIVKPLEMREVVARVRAVFRRFAPEDSGKISFDKLTIDKEAYDLIIDGKLSENDVVRVDVDNDGNIVVVKDEEASSKARAQRATSPEDVPVEPDSVE